MSETHPTVAFIRQIAAMEPKFWRDIEDLREKMSRSEKWPDWCYLPSRFLYSHGFLPPARRLVRPKDRDEEDFIRAKFAAMLYLASWRSSQLIYRFDQTLIEELEKTQIKGNLPSELLLRLPAWRVFIETPWINIPGSSEKAVGFFVGLDYDDIHYFKPIMNFNFISKKSISGERVYAQTYLFDLIIGDWTIDESLERVKEYLQIKNLSVFSASETDETAKLARAVLPFVLYLCSDQPDMPALPPVHRHKKTGRIVPPQEPRIWDVGTRIGAAIRRSRQEQQIESESQGGTGSRKRPHVRAAHWHTFLTGPRKSDEPQKPRVRWIPPIGVNLDLGEAIPTIRPVKGQ